MADRPVQVPALVRQKIAQEGEPGQQWLAGLADLIAGLEGQWSITVGRRLTGGSESYVARALTADGRDAVLKLAIPGHDLASQVRTIDSAKGRGYVLLLAHDLDRRAMLTEALGPSMADLALPPERAIDLLSQTLRLAWRVPRPAGLAVIVAEEKALQLGEMVSRQWEDLGRPCPERVAARALQFAEARAAAFSADRCVVVHGDPHPANALQVVAPRAGAESGFVLIDPDGFLADPAYDLGVVLRDWCPQLLAGDAPALARRYCERLAARSGIDATAIWEWGFLERVSTGLYLLDLGAEEMSRPFLQTAELLA